MELFSTFLSLSNLPASWTVVFVAIALATAAFFQWKKLQLQERSSDSSAHHETMELLMKQIEILGKQLESTREQLNELHDRNVDLMNQLREANGKIAELELILTSLGHRLSTP